MRNNVTIQKTIASANINFLIGAGLSTPLLEVLKDIEEQLSTAENDAKKVIEIKKEYFNKSICKNLKLVKGNIESHKVLKNYKNFYKTINQIILQRESTLLSKQVNIFTTNIDIFSEIALENTGIEFNDGFHGRFKPKYDVGNFKKSYYKTSLHYENTSEIPVFNILKLHGSVSWSKQERGITLDNDLSLVNEVKNSIDNDNFKKNYEKLMIVNPTKNKFEDTILNQIYYDLLRIYANELEKENSILFVMGFSFADEHIRDLTLRVANANPTNIIYIFVYEDSKIYKELVKNSKNNNIILLKKEYSFEKINKFFSKQLNAGNEQKPDKTSKSTK